MRGGERRGTVRNDIISKTMKKKYNDSEKTGIDRHSREERMDDGERGKWEAGKQPYLDYPPRQILARVPPVPCP